MCTRDDLVKCKKLDVTNISDNILDKFYSAIDEFYKKGYQITVAPMGLGEPFLYPDLFKFIEKIKIIGKDIKIVVVSNGIIFNESLGKKLINSGLDELSISLNANSQNSYKKYMGVDAYNLVKKNIIKFISLRERYKSKLPHIYIQYLDFNNNFHRFDKSIKEWQRIMLSGDKCYIHPIVNQAGYKQGVKKIGDNYSYPCIQPLSRLAIKINGDVYPCDACFYNGTGKNKQLFLGNIKDTKLLYIYENENNKSHQIIKSMRQNDYSNLPTCERCTTYKLSPNCFFCLPLDIKINKFKWF